MENERSYAKESFKSTPTGIRFNLKLEKIALSKSQKKTRQQLVDFLLENYVNGENPVLERQMPQSDPINSFIPPAPEIRKSAIEWVQEKRDIPEGDYEGYQDFIKMLDKAKYLTEKVIKEIKFA